MMDEGTKYIWTLRAEQTFKKYLRTWPGLPKEIARAIIEATAFKDSTTEVDREHVIMGLNRYNAFGEKGIVPFEDIEIVTRQPYGFRPVVKDVLAATDVARSAMLAEEWRSE